MPRKLKQRTNEKAITLIVLIITVIVLLILAGVTIATLTGENGILTKAKEASKQTEIEGIREKAEIAKQGVLTQDLVAGIKTTREDIINAIVNEMGGTASGNLITTEDGKYEIMVKEDNTIEVVEKGQGYTDAEYKEAAPESDFRWTTLEDGTIRIIEYLGTETSLRIPDTIDGKAVTVIWMDKKLQVGSEPVGGGESGSIFLGYGGIITKNVKLKSVYIPDSVTQIGDLAFSYNELEYIKLPPNLFELSPSVFSNNKIKDIKFNDKLTTIGKSAFSQNQLTDLKIPDSIITIGSFAFSHNSIKNLELNEGLETISSDAFSRNQIGKLIIPNSVVEIGGGAFQENRLTKIEYGNSLTTIGERAFYNNELTEINIPSTVISLGGGAFTSNKVEKIIYGINVNGEDKSIISSYAGENAGNVVVTEGVKEIGAYAFYNVGLTGIQLPEGLQKVGTSSIELGDTDQLIIPSTLKEFGMFAINTGNLNTLEFKGTTDSMHLYTGSIMVKSVQRVKVPYSEGHTILNNYKKLIEDIAILFGNDDYIITDEEI